MSSHPFQLEIIWFVYNKQEHFYGGISKSVRSLAHWRLVQLKFQCGSPAQKVQVLHIDVHRHILLCTVLQGYKQMLSQT